MTIYVSLKSQKLREVIADAIAKHFNGKTFTVPVPSGAQWSSGDENGNRVPGTYRRVSGIIGEYTATSSNGSVDLKLNYIVNLSTSET
jgi:hypothetical protein